MAFLGDPTSDVYKITNTQNELDEFFSVLDEHKLIEEKDSFKDSMQTMIQDQLRRETDKLFVDEEAKKECPPEEEIAVGSIKVDPLTYQPMYYDGTSWTPMNAVPPEEEIPLPEEDMEVESINDSGLTFTGYDGTVTASCIGTASIASSYITPSSMLTICNPNDYGTEIIRIENDGTVVIADHVELDEASAMFYEQLGMDNPTKLKKEIEDLKKELELLNDSAAVYHKHRLLVKVMDDFIRQQAQGEPEPEPEPHDPTSRIPEELLKEKEEAPSHSHSLFFTNEMGDHLRFEDSGSIGMGITDPRGVVFVKEPEEYSLLLYPEDGEDTNENAYDRAMAAMGI